MILPFNKSFETDDLIRRTYFLLRKESRQRNLATLGLQSSMKKAKHTASAIRGGAKGAATRQGKYGFAVLSEEIKAYDFSKLRGFLGGYPPMSFGGRGI